MKAGEVWIGKYTGEMIRIKTIEWDSINSHQVVVFNIIDKKNCDIIKGIAMDSDGFFKKYKKVYNEKR